MSWGVVQSPFLHLAIQPHTFSTSLKAFVTRFGAAVPTETLDTHTAMDSVPSSLTEVLTRVANHFNELLPQIPTAVTLTFAAIIPIYTGAHASLSRPSTAAKPSKKTRSKSKSTSKSSDKRMEGLTPIDALLYPLATGAMLTGLYYLIKWLEDPALLNKILNCYLSIFGTFSIWHMVRDLQIVAKGFLFPTRYSRAGKIWIVREDERQFASFNSDSPVENQITASPLPGRLSRIPLPSWLVRALWRIREAETQPCAVIDVFAKEVGDAMINVDYSTISATLIALAAVLYYNLVSNPWWLTNLLGFSFCYSALQILSPTTFWTGTLILTSLFFYDIYFVFYTPMMIEVATKLDIPVKLLIPKPGDLNQPPDKQALTLLGLGDIVLPGIMLGLALRFDLYIHYLKRQKRGKTESKEKLDEDSNSTTNLVKAEFIPATGNWGERFWLDSQAVKQEGGNFSKPYFSAGMIGYILGMCITQIVMHVSKHGQPALLYLVPSVLGSLWTTAAIRGEIQHMWNYTEDESGDKTEKKKIVLSEDKNTSEGSEIAAESSSRTTKESKDQPAQPADREDKKQPSMIDDRRIFHLSISLPPRSRLTSGSPSGTQTESEAMEKGTITPQDKDDQDVSESELSISKSSSFELLAGE